MMNPEARDRHGQPVEYAVRKFKLNQVRKEFVLRMVRGVFVVKWIVQDRYTGKKVHSYSALGPGGQIVKGIGSRQETITAAGGRKD